MRIVDSTFAGVTASGQAPVVLSNSHVFFDNVTFDRNCQSNAGAISVNQTSFATIDNSLFTNNLGFEAGAIAVGGRVIFSCFYCGYWLSSCLFQDTILPKAVPCTDCQSSTCFLLYCWCIWP